jgi:hypothetical protein
MNYHRHLSSQTLVATLALVSGWTIAPASFAQKPATGKAPTSFVLPKTKYNVQSKWRRINANYYLETYPPGSKEQNQIHKIAGRTRMNGVAGTITQRPNVKVFIPDVGSGSLWASLHWKGSWNKKWRQISNVQYDSKIATAFNQQNKR